MLLDGVDFFLGEFERCAPAPCARYRAESAVGLVPPRAPGDLRHFRRSQPPLAHAVELGQPRKSDVMDIKIEPHTDGIGGDDVIDLARLEQFHLPVARLRAERPHHHRRPAAKTAQQFGHLVHLLDREGDHGRARWQAREFAHPGMAERGKARSPLDLRARQQLAHHRLQGGGAEQHRLVAPARVEQPVGENVPAFAIRRELRFVERHEGATTAIARHGLRRAEEIARIGRLDPFLAGDERAGSFALDRADLVIDLARQQPQREAYGAGGMAAHPLDGEMGLAGVGRAENGAQATVRGWLVHDYQFMALRPRPRNHSHRFPQVVARRTRLVEIKGIFTLTGQEYRQLR